jgi:signal transduction histidine kinase
LRHKVQTFVALYQQRLEIAQQISALRRSEPEALSLKDELSKTLALNETFVAAVSHDLKNPLNAILIATELLLSRCPPQERNIIERARSSARRMNHMIEQLFDLSRARLGGGVPLALEYNVDLSKLVEQVVAEVTVASPERPLHVSQRGDTCGRWDAERITRVISNLLGNAVRHGNPQAPIELELDGTQPDHVEISVSNGGEIPADVRPTLFAPFRDKDPLRKRTEGLGLGLFIVSEIVSAHGGSVSVTSANGRTCFSVLLPRQNAASERAVAAVG